MSGKVSAIMRDRPERSLMIVAYSMILVLLAGLITVVFVPADDYTLKKQHVNVRGSATEAEVHDELLAHASKVFGRPLRDGSGPGCETDTPLAKTSKLYWDTTVKDRRELGSFLEALGAKGYGVELGVQQGMFSEEMLKRWTSVSKYYLVDSWAHQPEYADRANFNQGVHNKYFANTKERLRQFEDKTVFVRNFSYAAVHQFPDCYFDFIYVDAVHTYEGALIDIIDWWPKLKWGGIMAGHDYVSGVIPGAGVFGVKDAADRFAVAVNRPLYVAPGAWPTFWMIK